MHEGLYLHPVIYMPSYLLYLLKRKLSGCHHAASSEIPPELICAVVRVVGLCADMSFYLRADLLCNHENCRVCNDQCIRSVRLHIVKLCKVFTHSVKVIVVSQNIGSNIHSHTVSMRKGNSLCHLLH